MAHQLDPRVVGRASARLRLQALAHHVEAVALEILDDPLELAARAVAIDRGAEAVALLARHAVKAADHEQAVGVDLEVVADAVARPAGRGRERLVRRLVAREADVSIRPEELPGPEL